MKFKNFLWKRSPGAIRFYNTKSNYQLVVDEETLGVLWDMCGKTEEALTDRQREYYSKLSAKNLMEPGMGNIPEERSQSPLTFVEFEVSATCNLRCKHCFALNDGGFFDWDMFQNALDESLKLGVVAVSLNGGEPLLHPQIVDMLCKSRQCNFGTILYTNGTLITPEFCDKVASLELNKVYISLDGFQKNHEMVRGIGTYEKALGAIRLLRSRDIRVWINSSVYPSNEDEIDAFQKFCLQELKVNGLRIFPIQPLGNALKHQELFQYPKKARNALVDIAEEHALPSRGDSILPCGAGVVLLYISASGKVYPCNYFRRTDVCIGNLKEKSLGEIYRTWLNQESIFTHFDIEKLSECKQCEAFARCIGSCRARALLFGKDIYGKDPWACMRRGFATESLPGYNATSEPR